MAQFVVVGVCWRTRVADGLLRAVGRAAVWQGPTAAAAKEHSRIGLEVIFGLYCGLVALGWIERQNKRLGAQVKEWRVNQRLTQAELAQRMTSRSGKTWRQTMIAKLESGSRPASYDELVVLAAALDVSPSEFFDNPSNNPGASEFDREVRLAERRVSILEEELSNLEERRELVEGQLEDARAHLRELHNRDLIETLRMDQL